MNQTRFTRTFWSVVLLTMAMTFAASSANAQPNVYVVNGNSQFGVVNLASGGFHTIGGTEPEPQASLVWGSNGSLYTVGTLSGDLESINPATGATSTVGSFGLPFFPTGLSTAFDLAGVNGKLYLTDFSNNLYSVNVSTGAASMIGPTGMPPDPNIPFTINPDGTINLCDEILYGVGNTLYATFDSGTFNPVTGALVLVSVPSDLWSIDPSTGKATLIGPTAFGLDGGVELNGNFDAFYLSFTGSQLVQLNLANGSTSFLNNMDPAAGLIFGAAPTPEPGTFLLLGSGLVGVSALVRRRFGKQ
ncbi:MAG TPA: PEP-CTERM sorting domain-containing protein [Terriglobales bacterium]|nr:PEP-CTERM sorting domain-containing protein [Terriglobales bacterium]